MLHVCASLCVYHVVSKQGNECTVEGVLRDWDHHSSALPLPSIHTGAQRQYGLHTRHSFNIQPPGFDILPPCSLNMVKSTINLVS